MSFRGIEVLGREDGGYSVTWQVGDTLYKHIWTDDKLAGTTYIAKRGFDWSEISPLSIPPEARYYFLRQGKIIGDLLESMSERHLEMDYDPEATPRRTD